jgi:hypothetical protein
MTMSGDTNMNPLQRILAPRTLTGVIGGVAIATLVAGCGGGGGSTNNRSSVATNSESGNTRQPSFQSFSAATGKVTGVGRAGATVKTSIGSKKVAFGTITTFTLTSSTSRSGVAVGDCVRITPSGDLRSRLPTAQPTSSPGTGPKVPSAVKATEVTITSRSKCAAPTFNRSGTSGPPSGFSAEGGGAGTIPMPTGSPGAGAIPPKAGSGTGTNRAGLAGGGFGVAGTVTAVNGSTITVTSQFGSGTTAVTTTGSTSYSVTNVAKAGSVKPGRCLLAIGDTASDGTLDARTVAISSPVNGSCPTRSRGFAGGFPPGGGPTTTNAGGTGA